MTCLTQHGHKAAIWESKASGLASKFVFFQGIIRVYKGIKAECWHQPYISLIFKMFYLILEKDNFVKAYCPFFGILREVTSEPDGWHLSIACKITPPEQTAPFQSQPSSSVKGKQSAEQVKTDVKKEIRPINKQSGRKHVWSLLSSHSSCDVVEQVSEDDLLYHIICSVVDGDKPKDITVLVSRRKPLRDEWVRTAPAAPALPASD